MSKLKTFKNTLSKSICCFIPLLHNEMKKGCSIIDRSMEKEPEKYISFSSILFIILQLHKNCKWMDSSDAICDVFLLLLMFVYLFIHKKVFSFSRSLLACVMHPQSILKFLPC